LGTAVGQPDAPASMGAQLYNLRRNQGRLGELAGGVRANLEALPHAPVWGAALALVYWETDQIAAAREQVDFLRATGFDHPPNWTWAAYMVCLSEAVCELHDRSAAAILYDR